MVITITATEDIHTVVTTVDTGIATVEATMEIATIINVGDDLI